jgi:phospholipid N-methyltransferase
MRDIFPNIKLGGIRMMISPKVLIQEKYLFLKKFLSSPGQMGSVTPSSKFLAKKMMESVPWEEVRSIAELGSGTGAITKFIHEAGKEDTQVLLFEKDPYLQRELAHQFPHFCCYSDASQLCNSMSQKGIEHLDCVISGLPFFNFPQAVREQLLEQITLSLKPNGLYIAFQYSLQKNKQLNNHFVVDTIQFVPLNFPPAFIYVCRKRDN